MVFFFPDELFVLVRQVGGEDQFLPKFGEPFSQFRINGWLELW